MPPTGSMFETTEIADGIRTIRTMSRKNFFCAGILKYAKAKQIAIKALTSGPANAISKSVCGFGCEVFE
jgi:hypothetical protein